ncbi:MAG: hypothetical protein WAN43_08675 [Rhodomicrobium sp.]|jgi:hypothetical protein
MILRAIVTGCALLGFAAAAHAGTASNPDRGDTGAPLKHRRHAHRFVYAESWYGFNKVVAPVRRAELGDQVRLPGGTWVYCEFSCEYTLRRQSLDFWQSHGAGGGNRVSPGASRWDFYVDGWGHRQPYMF